LKSEKLFVDGRTYVPTDGHFRPPLMLLGRLGGVDLKTPHHPVTNALTAFDNRFTHRRLIMSSPSVGVRYVATSVSECVYVCLSVRSHISKATRLPPELLPVGDGEWWRHYRN